MEAYFDNAATTRVFDEVKEIVDEEMTNNYGNPSSMHTKGVNAEKYIRYTKEIMAKNLKVDEKEIVFTSGGTESNNLALIGAALANQRNGKHIISTKIEHASVYNTLFFLESLGFRITFLDVDEKGIVDTNQLKEQLSEDTILVSTMIVNNEIGTIEPVEEISKIIKAYNKDIIYHVDAIQGYGKIKIYPKRMGIDLMSISGHKIHAPKGSGALFIRDKIKMKPIIYGGEQQKGMRSGTENVAGIAGLGKASEIIFNDFDNRYNKLMELKTHFIEGVTTIENVKNNSGLAPHISSISFPGIRSEVLLHALEEKGIYVSSGSACSSNHPAISGVLKAIKLDSSMWDSTLRFSFSCFNEIEQVDYAVDVLKDLVPKLRKFTRH